MISIQLHTRQFQEVKSHFINRHINSLLPRGKIPPATDKRQLPRLTIKSNFPLRLLLPLPHSMFHLQFSANPISLVSTVGILRTGFLVLEDCEIKNVEFR
ncbi:hypothetical protein NC652_007636 [Populus alba x Populus x berolinensis]|uniref:Uncharacterized protein n=1 Tax=Populus alba x Populus x berolinensis TaxID=444605 RepID=A0AAD6RHI0_9ROSI|nr:hypothetical protein NC651_007364 [Populus alba x Populus x berolinensis]KAJ6956622.1 hypothetical protein NC652_007636 [Populus alba x Populus x berolinensis]KAJ7008988.1 hypothetical protein NC653_007593 [Populus alba x Populus x berolinensis]